MHASLAVNASWSSSYPTFIGNLIVMNNCSWDGYRHLLVSYKSGGGRRSSRILCVPMYLPDLLGLVTFMSSFSYHNEWDSSTFSSIRRSTHNPNISSGGYFLEWVSESLSAKKACVSNHCFLSSPSPLFLTYLWLHHRQYKRFFYLVMFYTSFYNCFSFVYLNYLITHQPRTSSSNSVFTRGM